MLRDAWDDIKLRVSISRLYWLYMQNNTILLPIMMKRYVYTENIYIAASDTKDIEFEYIQHDSVA